MIQKVASSGTLNNKYLDLYTPSPFVRPNPNSCLRAWMTAPSADQRIDSLCSIGNKTCRHKKGGES